MTDTETGFYAELAIAKLNMQESQDGIPQKKIKAAKTRDFSNQSIGLAVMVSVCLSIFFGNSNIFAAVVLFWAILVPAFVVRRRKRLRQIRELQLSEHREKIASNIS